MKPRDLALRAQDVEAGLHGIKNLPAFASREFKRSFLAGKAARLASHIGGADVFESADIPRLECVADSLGIEPLVLPIVLDVLEAVDCVSVTRSGQDIIRVRENIPQYGDLYSKIGEHLASQHLTEVEKAALYSFNELVDSPRINDGSLPIQLLEKKYALPILEASDDAGLIRIVPTATGQELVFSPQHWDENLEDTHRLLTEYGDARFKAVHDRLRREPGMPLVASTQFDHVELAQKLAAAGILPSPTVKGLKGEVQFAFTPYRGFNEDPAVESKLVEKVRALLACVRYGQHFGTGSRIIYPTAILRTLRDKRKLAPHSDAYTQYKLLYDRGMVRLERISATSTRYVTTFIDTAENLRALDAAISLLEFGSPLEATDVVPNVRNYAIDATYAEPVVARARTLRDWSADAEQAIWNAINDIITS